VVCDPQMTRYAVADQMGNIRVHRLADDVVVRRFPTFGLVSYRMEFSADGRYLLAKYDHNSGAQLHIFDLQDGRTVWTTTDLPQRPIFAVSHDSRLVAFGQKDRSIRLVELQTGKETQQLPATDFRPDKFCFHPDGRKLAVGSEVSRTVFLWDLEHPTVGKRIANGEHVHSMDWSPDGQLLAVGCADYCAYVWKADDTSEPLAVCRGHQAEVVDVCFSNRGDLLATHSWDGTTRLWDPRTGRERLSVPGGGARLRFGPDDRRVALAKGVWQLAAGHECRTIPAHEQLGKDKGRKGPQYLTVSPDGRLIASCAKDGLRLWDLAGGREVAHLPIGHVRSAFFADRESLITSGERGQDRWPIRLGADQAGRLGIGPPQSLDPRPSSRRGSLSRDGRTLAVSSGGSVHLLDLEGKSLPRHLSGRPGLHDVALSADGCWAAAGSWQGKGVRLWDAHTGHVVKDWLMESPSASAAFSPDGRWLVTATGQEYRFWRVGIWEADKAIPRHPDAGTVPGVMAFTPDGRLLAVAWTRRVIQLVDTATCESLATLEPPDPGAEGIYSMCFNGEGSTLVAAIENHRLQVWDLREIRRQLRAMGLDWDPPAKPEIIPGEPPLPFGPAEVRTTR